MAQNVHQSPSLSVRPPFCKPSDPSSCRNVQKGCKKHISAHFCCQSEESQSGPAGLDLPQVGPAGRTLTDVQVSVSTPSGEQRAWLSQSMSPCWEGPRTLLRLFGRGAPGTDKNVSGTEYGDYGDEDGASELQLAQGDASFSFRLRGSEQ